MIRWRFDHMCDQDGVDVLGDVFNFEFTTYSVAYVSNRLLRELASPAWIRNKALGVKESETDPTLVRNKLM